MVLAQLHKLELLTADMIAQILSRDHLYAIICDHLRSFVRGYFWSINRATQRNSAQLSATQRNIISSLSRTC